MLNDYEAPIRPGLACPLQYAADTPDTRISRVTWEDDMAIGTLLTRRGHGKPSRCPLLNLTASSLSLSLTCSIRSIDRGRLIGSRATGRLHERAPAVAAWIRLAAVQSHHYALLYNAPACYC